MLEQCRQPNQPAPVAGAVVENDSTEVGIAFGDTLTIETGKDKGKKLSYHGKDQNGHIFVEGVYLHYFNDEQAKFIISMGKIRSGNLKRNTSITGRIIEQSNQRYVEKLLLANRRETGNDACNISIQSVPVSEQAHKQSGGSCYAHACATAIRAVEARIVGRCPEPFKELLGRIVDKYGPNGGLLSRVLEDFCEQKKLGRHGIHGHKDIQKSLKAGRVIVAGFDLPEYQWHLFSAFFRQNPTGIISKEDFDKDSRRMTDFPPELRKIGGHAAVISGYTKTGGKLIYKIKNSWGADFANNGYFLLEADALVICDCHDVFFRVDMLTSADIRNYLVQVVLKNANKSAGVRQDRYGCITIRGCSSAFELVQSTGEVPDYRSGKSRAAVVKIQKLLSKVDDVEVRDGGSIHVRGPKHTFLIGIANRVARKTENFGPARIARELRRLS